MPVPPWALYFGILIGVIWAVIYLKKEMFSPRAFKLLMIFIPIVGLFLSYAIWFLLLWQGA